MKKIKYILACVAIINLASCSEAYRDREPIGGMLTAEQYAKLANKMEMSLRGIYSLLYEYSSHDTFGERSIDMYTDLFCGDMALTNYNYGWFYSDEQGMSVSARSSYLWSYYYVMLRNINLVLVQIQETGIHQVVAQYGYPTEGYKALDADGKVVYTYTEQEISILNYYAQALTLRGYAYDQLATLFAPTVKDVLASYSLEEYLTLPIYTEDNLDNSQPLASLSEVFNRVEEDLENAIVCFDGINELFARESKLSVDGNVARAILAYSYLNRANPNRLTSQETLTAYRRAIQLSQEVIDSNEYSLLPQNELTTNGFNDVNTKCWMWGENVTIETATGLGSFFGQVDIHSYSYAWAGDTKVIDENLYKSMYAWDGRVNWFNDGKKNPTFILCPDKKFFSAASPTSTASDDIDREWLSDNVFLRYESLFLIAAEASYRLGEYDAAKNYLTAITDLRLNELDLTTAQTEYEQYKNALNQDNLLKEIYYNWRVEMWGEGYGLQTFRRLGAECEENGERTRGGNHCSEAGSKKQPNSASYTYQMPSSESTYNPEINKQK